MIELAQLGVTQFMNEKISREHQNRTSSTKKKSRQMLNHRKFPNADAGNDHDIVIFQTRLKNKETKSINRKSRECNNHKSQPTPVREEEKMDQKKSTLAK